MKLFIRCRKFMLLPALLFLCADISFAQQAQNLVLNPSFEAATYPVIRTWPSAVEPGQYILPGWITPTRGTADFYNSDLSVCDGYPVAKARTGEGRCALICGLGTQNVGSYNYKEYIQGKFATPLEAGKSYCVKFYVALDRSSPYTSTGIGAYISAQAPFSMRKDPLQNEPQIVSYKLITYEDGWTEISGTYTASGGEKFITIGSYSDTSVISLSSIGKSPLKSVSSSHIQRGAYFYIDDVSVIADGNCDVATKQPDMRPGDYYLFLLDISGSMQKSGNFELMKKQLVDFRQNLNENNRMAIMAFSDNAKMLVPFTAPSDSVELDSIIRNLKSHGITNGNLALTRICDLVDSMQLSQQIHVIIATDGTFSVSENTKNYVDSLLNKNHASFCVLQFGNSTNDDLEELSVRTPQGKYNYVNKRTLTRYMDEQKPEKMPSQNTVLYTKMEAINGSKIAEEILEDLSR